MACSVMANDCVCTLAVLIKGRLRVAFPSVSSGLLQELSIKAAMQKIANLFIFIIFLLLNFSCLYTILSYDNIDLPVENTVLKIGK
jgi:hypothetical protein